MSDLNAKQLCVVICWRKKKKYNAVLSDRIRSFANYKSTPISELTGGFTQIPKKKKKL